MTKESGLEVKIKAKKIASQKSGDDLEVHLREVTVKKGGDTTTMIDLRQYVPSTKTYGKGVAFPMDVARAFLNGDFLPEEV